MHKDKKTVVGICAKTHDPRCQEVANQLVRWLEERGHSAIYDKHLAKHAGLEKGAVTEKELRERSDLAVVLGGDGTLVSTARFFSSRDIPIVGVNLGTLGFLTEITLDEMLPTMERCLSGSMRTTERLMLDVTAYRGAEKIHSCTCLNDVVINKGAVARVIDIETFIGDSFLTHFKADGVILSSPTGSTGYCKSASGPIIYPSLNCLALVPICPLTMSNRPIVIPSDREVRFRVASSFDESVYLSCDGQEGTVLRESDLVIVKSSPHCIRLVASESKDYFEVLRTKLSWNER